MTNSEYWYSMNNDLYKTKYSEFMYDRKNEFCCYRCPHADDNAKSYGTVGPCGQQHCWVTVHCQDAEKDE